MKKTVEAKSTSRRAPGDDEIAAYSRAQSPPQAAICDALRALVEAELPQATAKVWHGSPVWFVDGNPVVGYSVSVKAVKLLFWNGQALDAKRLKPVGKYGAAEAAYSDAGQLDPELVRHWLKKAGTNIFDSRAFFKQRREAK